MVQVRGRDFAVTGEHRQKGRPRSQSAKQAVLDAAALRLCEVGFAGLSVGSIAERAGVSKATIYRWWPNKGALVVEAVGALARGAVPEPDTGSLDGDVRAALDDLLAFMASPLGGVVEALAAASQRNPELLQALEDRFLAGRREMVSKVLARAEERGELREGVDKDLVADVAVSLLFYRVRRPSVDYSLVEGFIKLLSAGVRCCCLAPVQIDNVASGR